MTDNKLVIIQSDINISDKKSPASIGRWVTENSFDATVTIESFNPAAPSDFAGLILFHDDDCFIALGKSVDSEGSTTIRLMAQSKNDYNESWDKLLPESDKPLRIKISSDGKGVYSFYYSMDNNSFEQVPLKLPADILSTKTAGNFTGTMVGVYATSQQ